MPLPSVTARRIVTQWMNVCKEIAARNKNSPFFSFNKYDDGYVILLQEMIAKEIERIQDETSFIP